MSKQICTTAYVDLGEIDSSDLITELKERGEYGCDPDLDVLRNIYQLRRTGQPYQELLDTYIQDTLGVIL